MNKFKSVDRNDHDTPGFFVHGGRARDLKQVEDFLTGDSHDQSKVQWFDGKKFHNIGYVEDTTRFEK